MKLLGNLLLTVSLILGMISAATSYVGFLDGDGEAFAEDGEHARLKAPAGAIELTADELDALRASYDAGEITAEAYTAGRKEVRPVLGPGADEGGTRLGSDRVAELEGAEVKAVFTKSFSFGRWRYWWLFLLSAVGLLTGSLLVRNAAKAEIAAAAASQGDSASTGSPDGALAALTDVVASLRGDLDGMADDAARLQAVIERVGEAQRTHVDVFVESRALLVGRMGLGGYAELMDRFAAAERQINRAWCAAADGVLEESRVCLASAEELLAETSTKL